MSRARALWLSGVAVITAIVLLAVIRAMIAPPAGGPSQANSPAGAGAGAGEDPSTDADSATRPTVRVWIAPFDNAGDDESLAPLGDGIPELLTVFASGAAALDLVERADIDRILAEQKLARSGLTSEPREIGRLAGATTMIAGSFARHGESLLINAKAIDVRSGAIQASAQAQGSPERLAQMVQDLLAGLVAGMREHLPRSSHAPAEFRPIENLHFLRGLSLFYAAAYRMALGEFMEAGTDGEQQGPTRLWMARCYLEIEAYDHALIELLRARGLGGAAASEAEMDTLLGRCRSHLTRKQAMVCERLAESRASGSN